MHKLNPKDLPELKVVDITLSRAIIIFATVVISFVLPVLGISYLQSHPVDLFPAPTETTTAQTTPQPQVAGVSTEAQTSTNLLGIDMGSEQGLLLTIGVILVGISFVIVMFLAVEGRKKH